MNLLMVGIVLLGCIVWLLSKYKTALLSAAGLSSPKISKSTFSKSTARPVALDGKTQISVKLIEREDVSHDSRRLRFALPSSEHALGLPIGNHVTLTFLEDGRTVSRAYTPTSSDEDIGWVEFVIKTYFPNKNPKFPEGGQMSQYLENLKIGQTINIRGPKGRLMYEGRGSFTVKDSPLDQHGNQRLVKTVGMIAGGTGITPMMQVLRSIWKDPADSTETYLLFCNQSEHDILLQKELEEARLKESNFNLWYTVDRAGPGWPYSSGFVTKEMLQEHMPPPSSDCLILMCGPGPMVHKACIPALKELGFTDDMLFAF